ncbi:hypothetical protein AXG93_154s1370 [Marchantia polymorpha subsp. ruderalis]|uniref:Glycoprotease 1 n=1 Tax=Marchantia polymorpha subsp. ruderalis TaxID=1480154 RepID=A0A176VJS7_MARPO|nr:hypothetical protein AXG93_154s1370 [Marchantia polymorpha subsp. ruderalis]
MFSFWGLKRVATTQELLWLQRTEEFWEKPLLHRFSARVCTTTRAYPCPVIFLGSGIVAKIEGGCAVEIVSKLLGQWGGVVPKLASEEHRKFIDKVVADALQNAGVQESDLSAVAVTIGPGLSLCLHVGVKKARNIAKAHRLPMVGVHHMEAHALVVRLIEKHVEFPFIVLLVSGGHNLLLLAQNVGQYVQLGTTVDDAIGEAYDKTARLLGLDMKKGGGPALEELAREGDPKAIKFSVPMRGPRYLNCNFSYAGLKNQVRMAIEARNIDGDEVPLSVATAEDRQIRADIAASFQRVAVQHLEDKCRRAVEWARRLAPSVTSLVVSGGVASNHTVRSRLGALASELDLQLVCPPPRLCTDNGVMVAWAGVEHLRLGMFEEPPDQDEPDDVRVDLRPRWQLGEIYEEGQSEARSLKRMGHHQSLTAQAHAGRLASSRARTPVEDGPDDPCQPSPAHSADYCRALLTGRRLGPARNVNKGCVGVVQVLSVRPRESCQTGCRSVDLPSVGSEDGCTYGRHMEAQGHGSVPNLEGKAAESSWCQLPWRRTGDPLEMDLRRRSAPAFDPVKVRCDALMAVERDEYSPPFE